MTLILIKVSNIQAEVEALKMSLYVSHHSYKKIRQALSDLPLARAWACFQTPVIAPIDFGIVIINDQLDHLPVRPKMLDKNTAFLTQVAGLPILDTFNTT